MNTPTPKQFRGGRVFTDDENPQPAKPQRLRYPCFADGCPMPGTTFMSGTDKPGTCPWHYGVQPSDIPRVTQRLIDWQCVVAEVNAARRVLTGEAASDPRAQDQAQAQAWQRLAPALEMSGWADELKPGQSEHYAEWGRRLECFVGARVVEVLSTFRRRDA